ncbi:MAG: AI-2E family transporter [Chloroflexi bacterium HGW-Chloroflexi-1]|nr:MAG: AI-2E family transporter [Chloroflexi bacterium HGW-Chloroflexi-1]
MRGWSVARRNRFFLITTLTLIVLAVLWVARGALFPYIFALTLAYLMLPGVNWLDQKLRQVFKRTRFTATRPIAILLVYLLTVGLLMSFFSLVMPVISQQFSVLWANRQQLIAGARELIDSTLVWYQGNVPRDVRMQVDALLRQAAGTVGRALQMGVTRTLSVVTGTLSFVLGMVVVPFWLFYVLHDQSKMMRGVFKLLPSRYRTDFLNLLRITDDVLGAYLRGQLLLCLFIGLMATIGLTLLGVQFAAVLGLIAGVFEILPFIGPIIGLVPAVIVAAIQSPLLGLWTLLLFLGIQQVENLFLVPRISGKAVQLHPALIMVVLVLGNEVAGLLGMLLAVPLTAVLRDLFKYLYLRFQDQPVGPKEAMVRLGRTPLQLDV